MKRWFSRVAGMREALSFFRGTVAQFLGVSSVNLFARIVGMVGSVWMARRLEPAEIGIIALVVTLQNPLLRCITLGLDPVLVRATHGADEQEACKVFRHFVHKKLKVALFVAAGWVAVFVGIWIYGGGALPIVALILTPYFLAAALGALGIAQRFGRLRENAFIELCSAFLLSAALLVFLSNGSGVFMAAGLMAGAALLASLVTAAWTRRVLGRASVAEDEKAFTTRVRLRQGIWPLMISLASFGYTTLEIPLVGAFYGLDSAGLYRVASTLPMALFMFVYTFGNIIFPKYVAWSVDREALLSKLRALSYLMLSMFVIGSTLMFFSADVWIRLLFGERYMAAAPLLVVLWAGKLIVLWVNVWSLPLVALGQERFVAITAVVVSIACVVCNWLLANGSLGSMAVAVLSFTAELVVGISCWIRIRFILKT